MKKNPSIHAISYKDRCINKLTLHLPTKAHVIKFSTINIMLKSEPHYIKIGSTFLYEKFQLRLSELMDEFISL